MMIAAVTLVSCGEGEGEVTACSCLKDGQALAEKMKEAGDDPDKLSALNEEMDALNEKCKDFEEGDAKDCE